MRAHKNGSRDLDNVFPRVRAWLARSTARARAYSSVFMAAVRRETVGGGRVGVVGWLLGQSREYTTNKRARATDRGCTRDPYTTKCGECTHGRCIIYIHKRKPYTHGHRHKHKHNAHFCVHRGKTLARLRELVSRRYNYVHREFRKITARDHTQTLAKHSSFSLLIRNHINCIMQMLARAHKAQA